jgi:alpha-methylacyl-CoA racemase
MPGPLDGIRIVEFAGIGPGPFCGMMLADHGAEVIRIDRASGSRGGSQPVTSKDVLARGRKSIAIDLKSDEGVALARKIAASADGIIEGFRPGVMERLGLGPEQLLKDNPKLVYGRMTGWGQTGPYAPYAGHDINYIALSGALHAIGRAGEKPVPPLNLVGDFGGGGMLLAFGIACALIEAQRSGKGQVVDAAMVDGSALLMAMFFGFRASGLQSEERGTNLLDGGAHFYDTYETKDGQHVAVGALEPQFYAELLSKLGIDAGSLPPQMERAHWPALKQKLAETFKQKTRAEWCALLEGSDACFAPVLSIGEAAAHPHVRARGTLVEIGGVLQPAPAPRFSRTQPALPAPPSNAGQDTDTALCAWGLSAERIAALRASRAIG